MRWEAFLPTLFFPGVFFWAALLMWPMVFGNTAWTLALIVVLLCTPLVSLWAAYFVKSRRYYAVVAGVLVAQVALEAAINNWFGS